MSKIGERERERLDGDDLAGGKAGNDDELPLATRNGKDGGALLMAHQGREKRQLGECGRRKWRRESRATTVLGGGKEVQR